MSPSPPERDTQIDLICTQQMTRARTSRSRAELRVLRGCRPLADDAL